MKNIKSYLLVVIAFISLSVSAQKAEKIDPRDIQGGMWVPSLLEGMNAQEMAQLGMKMSVNDICGKLGAEQSLISHHLTNMRKSSVLGCRREGKSVMYTLELKELEKVVECVDNCKRVLA